MSPENAESLSLPRLEWGWAMTREEKLPILSKFQKMVKTAERWGSIPHEYPSERGC